MIYNYEVQIQDSTISMKFSSLKYCDWYLICNKSNMLDSNIIRYIFDKYVLSLKISDGEYERDLPVNTLIKDYLNLVQPFMEIIEKKSNFSDENYLHKELDALEKSASNLYEVYDLFLLIHIGMDNYLKTLDMEFSKRLILIHKIQEKTHINVKDRLEIFNTTKFNEVDLISSHEEYAKKLADARIKVDKVQEVRKTSKEDIKPSVSNKTVSGSLMEQAEQTKDILQQAIRLEKINPKKFDPVKDELDYIEADNQVDIELSKQQIKQKKD